MRPEALLTLVLCSTLGHASGTPLAIVCQVEGEPLLRPARGKAEPLRLFQWIPAGARLQTSGASRAVLVYADGSRFALGGESLAELRPEGLRTLRGKVAKLDPVPMIPAMAKAPLGVPGRPGGMTVRNLGGPPPWVRAKFPPDGGALLASSAHLSFMPVDPGGQFRIRILDASGAVVHAQEGPAREMAVPPRALEAGARYTWEVVQLDTHPPRTLRASFRTVPAREAEVRERLRAEQARNPSPEISNLLEAMDRWLGLKP
ncbi:MAG: hypothetical protein HY823_13520 [Acidobacteria bacterium]|nr:hypothetical protein [Acidobacteriota bacterium]